MSAESRMGASLSAGSLNTENHNSDTRTAGTDMVVDQVVAHYTRVIQDALNAMDMASIHQLVREIERELASPN